jgi:stress response protein YsnF
MKLKWLFSNMQVTIMMTAATTAGFLAGCSSEDEGRGGSYSYYASPSSGAVGGTADTSESQSSSSSSTAATTANTVIPLYKESVNVGTRQVDDGTVRLRKVVKTETVNEPVQLRSESVVIERVPAATGSTADAGSQAFQNQEVAIQLHHDEPVVETQVVPTGQIVAQTRSDLRQTNIQKQVRSEDVAVDKGNAQNVIVSDNLTSNPNEAMGGGGDINSAATGAGASGTITEPSKLTSAQVAAVDGSAVQLNNVKVDQVSGHMICIKDDLGRPLYIRSSAPLDSVKEGDTINITGKVKRVSPTSATSMTDLSDQMMQSFKGQQLYVDAKSVDLAK